MFHDSFELKKKEFIEERNLEAFHLIHKKTKAEVLYLKNDDKNKTFEIAFKTLPQDSRGIPHILEHSVLAGSKKYPVSDPFFEMSKTSLNTFLNAMTSRDKTMYPVASMNAKDFSNLVDVYLDAVFDPLLTEDTFKREGWHYELNAKDDVLKVNGIVFNEMKGNYSSADDVLDEEVFSRVFDNAYKYDAGGNPEKILDLTYSDFLNFYKKHYHPSNSYTLLYGDLDIKQALSKIEEYFSRYDFKKFEDGIKPSIQINKETIKSKIPVSNENSNKGTFISAYVLPKKLEPLEDLALGILCFYLFNSKASPFKRALLDSGLGEDLSGWGYWSSFLQPVIATGLDKVVPENFEKVSSLIGKTFEKISNGIEKEDMVAVIDRNYFASRENNTDQKGIKLASMVYGDWLWGIDPIDSLKFEDLFTKLRNNFEEDEHYFEKILKKYFLNDDYRFEFEFYPDVNYISTKENEILEVIKSKETKMSESTLLQIVEETSKYKKWIDTKESGDQLDCLPKLSLKDVDKVIPKTYTKVLEEFPCEILHNKYKTNGIIYLDIAFDFSKFQVELLPYLALYRMSLLDIGTKKRNYQELSTLISKTGGVDIARLITEEFDSLEVVARLVVRSKFLKDKTPQMLDILNELFFEIELDNPERLKQILLRAKNSFENNLLFRGLGVVINRASSHLDYVSFISEKLGGVDFYLFIKEILSDYESKYEEVKERLEEIKSKIINLENCVVSIGFEDSISEEISIPLKYFLEKIPSSKSNSESKLSEFTLAPKKEAFIFPSQVNYVGSAAFLKNYDYFKPYSTFVTLLRDYLLQELRFKGGAYGGGAKVMSKGGLLGFYSYRDPNFLTTLKIFNESLEEMKKIDHIKSKVEGMIISSTSGQDINESFQGTNWLSLARYLGGYSYDVLQKKRDEILKTTYESFIEFLRGVELEPEPGLEESTSVITGNISNELKEYDIYKL